MSNHSSTTSVQKDEFGQDPARVKCSYTRIHLFLMYQKALRTAALPAVMLKLFGYFSHLVRPCAACSRGTSFGRRVGLDDPQRSLSTTTILWFCDEVAKPLLVSPGITSSTTTWRRGTTVWGEYISCLLFTLQHAAKKQPLFAKKAGHRKQVHKQVLSMGLHNRIRNSLSILLWVST